MNKNLKNSLLASAVIAALGLSACNDTKTVQAETKTTMASVKADAKEMLSSQQKLAGLYHQAKQSLFKGRALSATMYGLSKQDVGQDISGEMEFFSTDDEKQLRAELLSISNEKSIISIFPPIPAILIASVKFKLSGKEFNIIAKAIIIPLIITNICCF